LRSASRIAREPASAARAAARVHAGFFGLTKKVCHVKHLSYTPASSRAEEAGVHRKNPLSASQEMYLKTLYGIRGKHDVARVSDLASGMRVSPGTASAVLKKLERLQLVDHERYGVVALTPAGHRVAECVLRRFETVRDVLVEVFGIDAETAAVDACMMEHAVSPVTVNRMGLLLERLRAGRPPVPARWNRIAQHDPCSECEVAGTCQAEASLE
jgi:DtxR family Mn-dependent transcriptional regulator